ncbi:MAG: sodium-independent anion transporter [Gammaproteobacteria bacterium]|nr:sodium-independent anion transporter [Gammaproteobacteria bacterium]HBW84667.1 sodium-independent anion transporter [Gammaproteobacteria bacterium]|tara:strand:+ start:11727 stop:13391 length:1665 start_codon:yes stop_codon:yes gene_type:complete
MIDFKTKDLKGDLFGGLTAGVVALPLALAFGEASGAGPIAGLYGAIFVGFFASLFGGTGSQVTGPTGPMVVVFAGVYAALDGNPSLVFTTVVLAGAIQVLFGVFRLGQYIRLVPYPVISGFMSGIGCIIIALQASLLLGHEPEESGTIGALMEIPRAVADPNLVALILGALTLLIAFKWPARLAKIVPPPLAALVIGTLVSLFLTGAPTLGEIPTGLPSFIMPRLDQGTILIVFQAAITLALLGSIDSLLTSLVADNMTRTRHNSNRELIGQGIGNVVAGLFGGIASAGATMRTMINIRTGGTTKISGMFHSLFLLAIVIVLAPLAEKIPHTVLAGILIKTGWDIIDRAYILKAHRGPRWDLALMLLVLTMTVFVDLIQAVGAGVVLASLAFVKQIADEQLKSLRDIANEGLSTNFSEEEAKLMANTHTRINVFGFAGPLSFGAAADFGSKIREKSQGPSQIIILDFSQVPSLDLSAARAVETVAVDGKISNKLVYISGMTDQIRNMLTDLMGEIVPREQYFNSRRDAITAAVRFVENTEADPLDEGNAKPLSV